jgi:hypothetical protein
MIGRWKRPVSGFGPEDSVEKLVEVPAQVVEPADLGASVTGGVILVQDVGSSDPHDRLQPVNLVGYLRIERGEGRKSGFTEVGLLEELILPAVIDVEPQVFEQFTIA